LFQPLFVQHLAEQETFFTEEDVNSVSRLNHGSPRLDIKRTDPFELINTKIVRTGFKFVDKRLFVMEKKKKEEEENGH